LVFICQQLAVRSWTHYYCRFKRLSYIVEELIKLAGVLNTVVSLNFDKSLIVELPFWGTLLVKPLLFPLFSSSAYGGGGYLL
jgi:hypothetical protein